MKKFLLIILIAVCSVNYVEAQFYISGSGGYAIGSAGTMMGYKVNSSGEEAVYGSYGQGLNGQLRFGYFFNDTFGIDLGIGYLHGDDKTLRDIQLPGQDIDIIGHGRAFGAMPALVYKFNENIYGRLGAVLKIGGKTEVEGTINTALPAQAINPMLPATTVATLNVDFTRDFKGELPLGFTAAIGYKHDLSEKFALFVEAEYLGISVRRDKATLEDFSATLDIPGVGTSNPTNAELLAVIGNSPTLSADPTIQTLAVLISDETDYVDKRKHTDNSTLAETVPYSSFGINIGITYSFGK